MSPTGCTSLFYHLSNGTLISAVLLYLRLGLGLVRGRGTVTLVTACDARRSAGHADQVAAVLVQPMPDFGHHVNAVVERLALLRSGAAASACSTTTQDEESWHSAEKHDLDRVPTARITPAGRSSRRRKQPLGRSLLGAFAAPVPRRALACSAPSSSSASSPSGEGGATGPAFDQILLRDGPRPREAEAAGVGGRRLRVRPRASPPCRPSRSARARASGRRRPPPPSPSRSSAPPSAARARRRCSEADARRVDALARRAGNVVADAAASASASALPRGSSRNLTPSPPPLAREERQRAPADAAARHAAAKDAPRARRAQPDERARAHPAAAAADDAAGATAVAAGAREQGLRNCVNKSVPKLLLHSTVMPQRPRPKKTSYNMISA